MTLTFIFWEENKDPFNFAYVRKSVTLNTIKDLHEFFTMIERKRLDGVVKFAIKGYKYDCDTETGDIKNLSIAFEETYD